MLSLEKQLEAFTQALVLAVTASTEKKSHAALKLAEGFAFGLSKKAIESCKLHAEQILNRMKNHA